jgi:Cyclic nucleotide-binding domain
MGDPDKATTLRATGRTLSPLLDNDDPALFPKLTDEQYGLLAKHGQVRSIEAGELLFREGDATYDVMVLIEGSVMVVIGSGDAERELAIQRPRDLMVELNILTGERVQATGVVREAGSVLVVPASEFRAILGRELVFGDFVLQTFVVGEPSSDSEWESKSSDRVLTATPIGCASSPRATACSTIGWTARIPAPKRCSVCTTAEYRDQWLCLEAALCCTIPPTPS